MQTLPDSLRDPRVMEEPLAGRCRGIIPLPHRPVEPGLCRRSFQSLKPPVATIRLTTAPFFCSTCTWSFLRYG